MLTINHKYLDKLKQTNNNTKLQLILSGFVAYNILAKTNKILNLQQIGKIQFAHKYIFGCLVL